MRTVQPTPRRTAFVAAMILVALRADVRARNRAAPIRS